MSIRENEEKLFNRWKRRRPSLVKDGVVNEESYTQSDTKLLFLLKEANDRGGGGWDLRDFLQEGARGQTWNNVTRWVRGIRSLSEEIPWSDLEEITPAQRTQFLRSICVINFKKTPGGGTTDNDELERIAEEDRDYLNEQFSFYNPDLIVCGGSVTEHLFDKLILDRLIEPEKRRDWQLTSKGVPFNTLGPSKQVVSFHHPNLPRVRVCLLYYGLVDAIKEIRGRG